MACFFRSMAAYHFAMTESNLDEYLAESRLYVYFEGFFIKILLFCQMADIILEKPVKEKNMKKSLTNVMIVLLPIAIFLLGCIQPMRYENAIAKGYKIDATITKVESKVEEVEYAGEYTVDSIYVDYEVDGQKYENVKVGKYSDGGSKGEVIQIVVNPNNPGKVMKQGGVLATVGFILMLVMYIPAIVATVKEKKKNAQEAQKKENTV